MFGNKFRPTIKRCYEDELYAAERMLIDAQAKLDHANTIAGHHDVNVGMLKARIHRLREAVRADDDRKREIATEDASNFKDQE